MLIRIDHLERIRIGEGLTEDIRILEQELNPQSISFVAESASAFHSRYRASGGVFFTGTSSIALNEGRVITDSLSLSSSSSITINSSPSFRTSVNYTVESGGEFFDSRWSFNSLLQETNYRIVESSERRITEELEDHRITEDLTGIYAISSITFSDRREPWAGGVYYKLDGEWSRLKEITVRKSGEWHNARAYSKYAGIWRRVG